MYCDHQTGCKVVENRVSNLFFMDVSSDSLVDFQVDIFEPGMSDTAPPYSDAAASESDDAGELRTGRAASDGDSNDDRRWTAVDDADKLRASRTAGTDRAGCRREAVRWTCSSCRPVL